jgi:predicted helicase
LVRKQVRRVQILDPAAGTGTFLNEVIKLVYSRFKDQEGLWPGFVENELLQSLYGFELLMAAYAMAHMKLGITLIDTGYEPNGIQRLGVYLTNSLEEGDTGDEIPNLFGIARALTEEAHGANKVKNDTPVMVVIGNPPYSGESFNKGDFAKGLVANYKVEPGGKEKLKERNPKWINDDYVKFIALAEHMIEKNGEGVLGFITNHSYLDNPTFRGMRWHLSKTFNKIYILDLHGNMKKREVAPDGSKDENVFDIEQGVSIILGVKKVTLNDEPAKLYRSDLWGKRQDKYDILSSSRLDSIEWQKINLDPHQYGFTFDKDLKIQAEYNQGICVTDLFPVNSVGIVTARDSMSIQFNQENMQVVVDDFSSLEPEELRAKYKLGEDVRDWSVERAIKDIKIHEGEYIPIAYRPFDTRASYFTGTSRGFHCYPRIGIMRQYLLGDNVGLMVCRQQKTRGFHHILVHKIVVESSFVSNKTSEIGSSFPLYLYFDEAHKLKRQPNIDTKFVEQLLANLKNYKWIEDHKIKNTKDHNEVSPLDILDYVYGILHSPSYRERYVDFLKSNFPRVPKAKDSNQFWQIVGLGARLRKLHLLDDHELNNLVTTYPVNGPSAVERVAFNDNKVWINDTQYFGNVSKVVWDFYVGSYQPAQKWLKDRKNMKLSNEDIVHYQKIIKVLVETDKIMKQIDA